MKQETESKVLLLENNPEVLKKVEETLSIRPYKTTCFSSGNKALEALKENFFYLVIAEQNDEDQDPVNVMKSFIMTSPMSSVIMITDLSDSEVDERAEGYGILGNIARNVPTEALVSLLDTYEEIQQSIRGK